MTQKKTTAGRKPLPEKDKVQPVQVYITKSHIDAIGGIEQARKIAKASVWAAPIKKSKK